MDFLIEYGMFLAQAVTIVIAIIVVIAAIANAGQKNKKHLEGHIEVTNLSEEIEDVKEGMLKELLSEDEYKVLLKKNKKKEKEEQKLNKKKAKALAKDKEAAKDVADKVDEQASSEKAEDESAEQSEETDDTKSRIFVLNFDGDVEASAVENLREEITAVIIAADPGDKVLVKVESPGGLVHAYGLAASQLTRIKDAELELIVAVDQVAASGGYMMACVADKIIAAPFAVVGSIGVVAEIPNFHRLLKHNKVDYEQHTAGEYKRTLTMFAENTDDARKKFKQELEETHDLFKDFIIQNREKLDIEKVATGEHWYGTTALKLGLIDEIQTSDDFIIKFAKEADIFEITFRMKKPLAERLSFSVQSAVGKALMGIWQKGLESRLFKS
ncbi:protease SohB [Aliikangiella coralliicola]|uniref:Protease SohB n=1 Tax=Aliikangiella coralliicola TaxID=2592383 RepID=A0A545TWG5_9GAMM|nr:protease SohB [Aliikangiella coralliicola]TQV81560.1 protease SohB [Aliikangiella coralliicola]